MNGNQHFGHFRNIYPHVLTLQVCLFKNRISMIARDSQTVIVVTCDLTSDKSNGIERMKMVIYLQEEITVGIGELRVLKCNKNTTFFN